MTENIKDVHKYGDVDVILKSNAYDVNCYLMKKELEVSNPNFLKMQLDELRKNKGVVCVGDFWRSIKLKRVVNKETFNIIVISYLNLQVEASKHAESAIRTDSLRAQCRNYIAGAIKK